ncbi:MAG: Gfo/Idh/MocA family oxidoreductase [Candidatus Brockarchaeota archaeon]|nr:Gfo/Idh/MocA family oxidoreductase [Candidatus Brockarchaeota archaeon]
MVAIGIVGCGGIAQQHLSCLKQIPEAKVAAFCDIDLGRAKAMASSVHGSRAYKDVSEMLGAEKLDAVYVCVPPFAHGFEKLVVERGLHIFVEKPIALSLEMAKEIEAAIARAGVVNSVGYMWRYLDTTELAIKTLERNGPIGLVLGQYHDPYWFPPGHWWISKSKGGGQVVEQSTHVFDLVRYVAGDVSRVYGELGTLLLNEVPGFDVEDVSVVSLRFKSGAVGVVTSTCASRKTFTGTKVSFLAKNVAAELGGHAGYAKIYWDDRVEEAKANVDPYLEEDRVFVEAVRTGDASGVKSPYSDALETLKVTIFANKSSEDRRPYQVD